MPTYGQRRMRVSVCETLQFECCVHQLDLQRTLTLLLSPSPPLSQFLLLLPSLCLTRTHALSHVHKFSLFSRALSLSCARALCLCLSHTHARTHGSAQTDPSLRSTKHKASCLSTALGCYQTASFYPSCWCDTHTHIHIPPSTNTQHTHRYTHFHTHVLSVYRSTSPFQMPVCSLPHIHTHSRLHRVHVRHSAHVCPVSLSVFLACFLLVFVLSLLCAGCVAWLARAEALVKRSFARIKYLAHLRLPCMLDMSLRLFSPSACSNLSTYLFASLSVFLAACRSLCTLCMQT